MISLQECYGMLNCFDLHERIEYLQNADIDLSLEALPHSLVELFYQDIKTFDDADRVAQVFKNKLGLIVISRESSFMHKTFMTLMDDIIEYQRLFDHNLGVWLIKRAFINHGFKRAIECDQRLLAHMFCLDANYEPELEFINFDFQAIKNENQEFVNTLINHSLK